MWDRSTMCLRGARETAARVSAHAGGRRVLSKESLVRDRRRGTGTPSRDGTSALRAVHRTRSDSDWDRGRTEVFPAPAPRNRGDAATCGISAETLTRGLVP